MSDITLKVLLAIISVLGTILTYFVIPYLRTKIDANNLNKYKEWTKSAVKCAEMIYNESGMGKVKKEYVIKFIADMINKEKVHITEEQINVLIESAVEELNNAIKG